MSWSARDLFLCPDSRSMINNSNTNCFTSKGLPYLPQLQQPNRVQDAAVSDGVDVDLEIRLQPALLAVLLVQEAVGLGIVGEAAGHDIDMEVLPEIPCRAAAEAERLRSTA